MSDILKITKLADVIQWLDEADFNKNIWRDLGDKLGLHSNTLDTIDTNKRGDVDSCCRECLVKWLKRADGVDKVGKPSLETLADALDKMKDCKDQADYIRDLSEGKKPAKRQKPDPTSTKKSDAGYKHNDEEAQASASDEDTDGGTAQKDPPDWSYDDKIMKRVPKKRNFAKRHVKDIEILLMPATTSEEEPVLYYLKHSPEELIETEIDGLKVYIGHYGKSKVIVVMTAPDKGRQGSIHAGIITSKMLEKIPSIKYVVAVGVCFGMDQEKQKLGDVIISGTICDFTNKREGADEDDEYHRGPHHQVNRITVDKFRPTHGFEMPRNITVSTGVLISTGSLINHPDVKKELLEFRKDAIAGEMEGAGIMAAIDYVPDRGVSAIVIKGIGDWADGDKESTKKWKPFAAHAAAHYVHAVLNNWEQLQ